MRYTGPQIAAAIALSGLTQDKIAAEARIGRNTLNKIINGKAAYRPATIAKLCAVLEARGLEFLPGEGVRRKDRTLTILESPNAYQLLLDDIYNTLKLGGGEVRVAFADEAGGMAIASEALLRKHIKRLADAGITERLLVRNRDTTLIAPPEAYRRIPEDYFSPHQLYIYGGKIALLSRLRQPKAIVIDDERFADSMRKLFDFAWICSPPASRPMAR